MLKGISMDSMFVEKYFSCSRYSIYGPVVMALVFCSIVKFTIVYTILYSVK